MSTLANEALSTSAFVPMRLLTAADLAAMPDELPSGPVNFELHNGRLVPMSPTGGRHGNLQARLSKEFIVQGEDKGLGQTYSEAGVIIRRKPDTVVGPDVAFVTKRSTPIRESKEGYLETIPELVVEIRSKNDTRAFLDEKISDYLQAGVKLVWLVDPEVNKVHEHRQNQPSREFGVNDSLTCEDIIPGFSLPLAALFRE